MRLYTSASAAVILFSGISGALSEEKHLYLVKTPSLKKTISNHLATFRHETVVETMHVLGGNRGRRLRPDADAAVDASTNTKSGKTTSKSAKATASSCQAKLDTCEATAAAPKWLFVQMADMCTLYRNEDGEYHIESSKFHKETEWFTDRPFHLEATQLTSAWLRTFQRCLMMRTRDTSRKERVRLAEKGSHMASTTAAAGAIRAACAWDALVNMYP
eukprot:scaffold18472_cov83-Skeletonema_marinoi.AAC.2